MLIALAARDFEGPLHLFDRAVYGIGDQFFMAVATGAAVIDLGNDVAEAVIAVRVDGRHRADAAGGRPGAGTGMVGNGHPLAAFYQGPDFPAAVNDGLQPLEQRNLPRKNPVAPDHMNAAL